MDFSPPVVVTSFDDVATGLQRLRLDAGVSYRELHRRVVRGRRRRRVPEVPAYDTVYRCLQTGRRRLDVELVAELVRALGGDLAAEADWRAACAAAGRHQLQDTLATASVEVSAIAAEPEVALVGRAAELTALTATPGCWLIAGMPGIGKTALALAAAAELRRSGTVDAAWLIRLRGWAEETAVDRATLAEAVELTLGPRADQRVALVVDDVSDPVVLDWLASSAVRPDWVLGTSRRRSATDDAVRVVALPPLAAADARRLLDPADALATDPGVDDLVRLGDGLPLSLVLTRARVAARPSWSAADHARQLTELRALRRLEGDVEASLMLSYQTLSPEESRTLRLLGTLPVASISPGVLQATLGLEQVDRVVAGLRDRFLLVPTGDGRVRLHDLVALFAASRSVEEDAPSVRRDALNRLLDTQAAVTAAAMARIAPHEAGRQPPGPEPPPGLEPVDDAAALLWLADERADLLRACGHARRRPQDHDRSQHVVRMSFLLFRYLDTYGWWSDAERLHGWAVAAAVDPADRARAWTVFGITAWSAGRWDDALERFESASSLYQRLDDVAGQGRVLLNLGGLSRDRGDLATAVRYGRRSLDLAVRTGDRGGQAAAHNNLGVAYEGLDQHGEALDHHRACWELSRELGDRYGEARALANLGDILLVLGEHDQARRSQSAALTIARDLDYDQCIADSLNNLATLDSLAGRHDEAVAGHREALRVADRAGLDGAVIRERLTETMQRAHRLR